MSTKMLWRVTKDIFFHRDVFKDEIKLVFVTRQIIAKWTYCVTCYAWKGKNQARGLTIENSILSQNLPATIWGAASSIYYYLSISPSHFLFNLTGGNTKTFSSHLFDHKEKTPIWTIILCCTQTKEAWTLIVNILAW